jgi:hypothetical protein
MSSWKNVRGLKCFEGVKSLNERGNFRRDVAGFVMRQLDIKLKTPGAKWKIRDIRDIRG